MASSLHIKRLTRERRDLEAPNNDYFVHFKDENLTQFDAYIIGPEDSLYRFKFVKIHFTISTQYPFAPPTCKFIQHSGGRIHPNLYNSPDGKVCLSILGTWPGEPWSQAMTINTVLLTIRSLLDNEPYRHEPQQSDCPAYNEFVRYTTWKSLLLDYLTNENDPACRKFLHEYVQKHSVHIMDELQRQERRTLAQGLRQFTSRYDARAPLIHDYPGLRKQLSQHCTSGRVLSTEHPATLPSPSSQIVLPKPSIQSLGNMNTYFKQAKPTNPVVKNHSKVEPAKASADFARPHGTMPANVPKLPNASKLTNTPKLTNASNITNAPKLNNTSEAATHAAIASSSKRKRETEVIVIDD